MEKRLPSRFLGPLVNPSLSIPYLIGLPVPERDECGVWLWLCDPLWLPPRGYQPALLSQVKSWVKIANSFFGLSSSSLKQTHSKQNKTKHNKNKLMEVDNRLVVPLRRWGWEWGRGEERIKWASGVKCMAIDGN